VPSRTLSNEAYVIDLRDEVLDAPALRRHRFGFLRRDAAPGKQGARLPVDAYYPDHHLVVEYRELQHTESIPIMDRRLTASGVDRGAQRAIYDQRRCGLLPRHGIARSGSPVGFPQPGWRSRDGRPTFAVSACDLGRRAAAARCGSDGGPADPGQVDTVSRIHCPKEPT
jgi:hypothetical protein